MGGLSPLAANGNAAFFTSLGPSTTPGGFSGRSFGTPGLPFGFGYPSYGDPMFYFQPAASSFNINRLLGFANGSAVNINIGPTPSTLGFGGLLLGMPFYADNGIPGSGPFGGGALGSFGDPNASILNQAAGGGFGGAGSPFGGMPSEAMGGASGQGVPGVVNPMAMGGAPQGAGGYPSMGGGYPGMGAAPQGYGGYPGMAPQGYDPSALAMGGSYPTMGGVPQGYGGYAPSMGGYPGLGGSLPGGFGGGALSADQSLFGGGASNPPAAPAPSPVKKILEALTLVTVLEKALKK